MKIAIPKERRPNEPRVAASPEVVEKLIGLGFQVVVEKGAGDGASFTDAAFREAGADIAKDARAALKTADIVFKIQAPLAAAVAVRPPVAAGARFPMRSARRGRVAPSAVAVAVTVTAEVVAVLPAAALALAQVEVGSLRDPSAAAAYAPAGPVSEHSDHRRHRSLPRSSESSTCASLSGIHAWINASENSCYATRPMAGEVDRPRRTLGGSWLV